MQQPTESRMAEVLCQEMEYLEDEHRHLLAALRANRERLRSIEAFLLAVAPSALEKCADVLPIVLGGL